MVRTATVIPHLHGRVAFAGRDPHLDSMRVGVLGGVCERFEDDEVRGRLNGQGEVPAAVDVERNGHGRAVGDGGKGGLEAAIGEDAGMDSARELAELLERGIELGARDLELAGRRGVWLDTRFETSKDQRNRDEPLLGAVVEVALDAAARAVLGLHDPRS